PPWYSTQSLGRGRSTRRLPSRLIASRSPARRPRSRSSWAGSVIWFLLLIVVKAGSSLRLTMYSTAASLTLPPPFSLGKYSIRFTFFLTPWRRQRAPLLSWRRNDETTARKEALMMLGSVPTPQR